MTRVAKTLNEIYTNPKFSTIRDLSQEVLPLAQELRDQWSFDLYSRSPGPAVTEDGEFVGTDLDLACFLSALADRGAVINLPTYKSRRAGEKREDEIVVSKGNRHGKILGLISNQETFSFSVRVLDYNVIVKNDDGSETVGAPRNFMLLDVNGEWRDWNRIEFSPTAKENDFLQNNALLANNRIDFSNFVHPNRWVSFYGQYYFLTKMMIERLEEEGRSLRVWIKEKSPVVEKSETKRERSAMPRQTRTETTVEVEAFEAKAMFGGFEGKLKKPRTLKKMQERLSEISGLLEKLRFAVRTVELAFFKHGRSKAGEKTPAWINTEWKRNYKLPKGRTEWNRLILGQEVVGEVGHGLLYRVYSKKEKVLT